MKALLRRGFREALLAMQRREDICSIALAGFLRDRGNSALVRRWWVLDGSIALQKVVLLNLVRLAELGVQYCPILRKSEDMAICYEVARTPGGHLLKTHRYSYRAVHLERGGAEEVRRESRRNGRATVSELALGGQAAVLRLPPGQRASVEAILAWLQLAQARARQADAHGDLDDAMEGAARALAAVRVPPCGTSVTMQTLEDAERSCRAAPKRSLSALGYSAPAAPGAWLRKRRSAAALDDREGSASAAVASTLLPTPRLGEHSGETTAPAARPPPPQCLQLTRRRGARQV